MAALTGDTDTAWTNNIYIYDEGIVSLNGPLPAGASLSDRSTLGSSFLAPGLIQSGAYSVEAYCGGSAEGQFGSCASNQGFSNPQLEILFGSGTTLFGVGITDNGPAGAATISKISVTFDYGATGPFPADTQNMPTANLPNGAIIGYNIGGAKLWTLAPSDPGADDRYNGSFDASMPGAPFGVPEPGTWLLMLSGIGIVGAGLRARPKARASAT